MLEKVRMERFPLYENPNLGENVYGFVVRFERIRCGHEVIGAAVNQKPPISLGWQFWDIKLSLSLPNHVEVSCAGRFGSAMAIGGGLLFQHENIEQYWIISGNRK